MPAWGAGDSLIIYITSIAEGVPRGRKRELETRTGRALLAYALNRVQPEISFRGADIPPLLCFGPQGKPAFHSLAWEFNISHSHGLVACGFSAGPLGLDLERVRPFPPRLAKRIQAPGEASLSENRLDCDELWTQLWTCKESYMKYTGLGMSQSTAEMPFARLGRAPALADGVSPVFRSFRLLRGEAPFWLTVCREKPGPLALEFIPERQIAALLA